jgi:hypothetical protein
MRCPVGKPHDLPTGSISARDLPIIHEIAFFINRFSWFADNGEEIRSESFEEIPPGPLV